MQKKILFHQDNAPCHMKTMVKLNDLHIELILHPQYSPDLALSDYWMLQGKRFRSNEEGIAYFEAKPKSFYKNGIERLEYHSRRKLY